MRDTHSRKAKHEPFISREIAPQMAASFAVGRADPVLEDASRHLWSARSDDGERAGQKWAGGRSS